MPLPRFSVGASLFPVRSASRRRAYTGGREWSLTEGGRSFDPQIGMLATGGLHTCGGDTPHEVVECGPAQATAFGPPTPTRGRGLCPHG